MMNTEVSVSNKLNVKIDPNTLVWRIVIVCVIIELSLVFLDWLVNYQRGIDISQIRRLFNIAREDGLAGWVAVFQTMFVAVVLWFIVYVEKLKNSGCWQVRGWGVLATFFTVMAIDDGAVVHERLGSAFKSLFHGDAANSLGSALLNFFPSYPWQLILLPFFSCMAIFMLLFVWSALSSRKLKYLLFLSFVPLVLAVILDFIEGLDAKHVWNIQVVLVHYFDTSEYTISHFSKSLEEFLEMLGNTMFLYLFLRHALYLIRDGLVVSVKT